MPTSKLSLAEQIARAKKHLADLEAKEKAGKFDTALAKHKQAINAIYIWLIEAYKVASTTLKTTYLNGEQDGFFWYLWSTKFID